MTPLSEEMKNEIVRSLHSRQGWEMMSEGGGGVKHERSGIAVILYNGGAYVDIRGYKRRLFSNSKNLYDAVAALLRRQDLDVLKNALSLLRPEA